ncbi:dihydroneopterin aldolase [Rhodobacter aestuarii]|uniref:dihydroneopterin aldolase n=1 Tax=Rhodobacter aestuarii TaxID=453582 RepID=A0A1N7L3I6_9RHOB|nr:MULTISPECIES: dihydroneopterin aldolase [Rhodobacter]PTV95404.1 dihydroneopterin aldolase [Rhodobacter aestuarii]SIS68361.1 dihydroneopterin aldolase [Rhodobacter aestuarii]SOB90351.1 dihydroneopterin aldolase [Rhodobacter sp. JA431]
MTSDTSLAFAHPEERALASAPADPRDRISLRDHVVEADIGAFQQERGHSQRLNFNVVVEVRPASGPLDDDVDRILSYDRITEAIAAELAAERLNLLETLAERVAERILLEPRAMRVFVRIEKLDRGPGALGVEIVRARASAPVQALHEDDAALHPVVAYLSNDVIAAPDLSARLDALAASGAPVILAVGMPEGVPPETGHRPTQRRIDLLAIEQNAWVLAARDPRCVVVATRTEIDWAMRHGQMLVWAPSKIVLDAVDGPKGAVREAGNLIIWLAEQLAAVRLELHGDVSAPAGSRVPVQTVAR